MNTRSILIGVLVALLIVAAWWFLFWRGTNTTLSDIDADFDTAQQTQQTLQARVDTLRQLQTQKGQFDAAVNEISVSIPDDPSQAALIESVRQLARDAGLVITDFTAIPPSPSPLNEDLFELTMNISLNGEYFRVLQFLFDLEDLDRLVRVDQITAASNFDSETATNNLEVTLTARAFSTSPLPGTFEPEAPPVEEEPVEEETTN